MKVTLLAMLLFALAPFLTLNARSQNSFGITQFRPVKWEKLLSHVSRQSGISLAEVRELAFRVLQTPIEGKKPVTALETQQLHAALFRMGIPVTRIFRWLPPSGNLPEAALADKPDLHLPVFVDVAVDHPVYSLWKPLLDLDIPVSLKAIAREGAYRADPDEPMSRSDWNYLVGIRLSGDVPETTEAQDSGRQLNSPEPREDPANPEAPKGLESPEISSGDDPSAATISWEEARAAIRLLRPDAPLPAEPQLPAEPLPDASPTRLEMLYHLAAALEGRL